MTLAAGTRLGPYEIVAPLGAGGMGQVYRARDLKLGRDVAIKFLPASLVDDADRLARFAREARVLASLTHPNIAAIYNFEDEAPFSTGASGPALVLELVEGETLAARIARGPLPMRDAFSIATSIADALATAHDRGIVHRDLKPGNVMLSSGNVVKVLDFGLAKATHDGTGDEEGNLPTAAGSGTAVGVVLGTAPYMSPEQARGQPVDRRTDIWAWGCVLYEMLTGRGAFGRATLTDTAAAIVGGEPDWAALPSWTPIGVRRLLQRCLAKDVRERWRDAGDLGAALEDVVNAPSSAASGVGGVGPHWVRQRWLSVAALAVAIAAAVIWWRSSPPAAPVLPIKFFVYPPPGTTFTSTAGAPWPSVSPDGRALAFVAVSSKGEQHLWLQALHSTTARPLAGTEGAMRPFWAPDSSAIGYFANGRMWRFDLPDGPPRVVTTVPYSGGLKASWGLDVIAFQAMADFYRVSPTGGAATPFVRAADPQRIRQLQNLSFLPDGRHYLFSATEDGKTRVCVAGVETPGRESCLLESESPARYAAPGYLLFVANGLLRAQAFDSERLLLSGEPLPISERRIRARPAWIAPSYSASANGVLAYHPSTGETILEWVDRTGQRIATLSPRGEYGDGDISPDERRVSYWRTDPDNERTDVWIYDADQGTDIRVTFDGVSSSSRFSPDGTELAYVTPRKEGRGIYAKSMNGAGQERLILSTRPESNVILKDWSRDGKYLLVQATQPGTGWDLLAVPASGDAKPIALATTEHGEREGRFAPDGHWFAYDSTETGRREVWVEPFPPTGSRWQVSTTGGFSPRWRSDGRELYYIAADGTLTSVPVTLGASFRFLKPAPLFETVFREEAYGGYDVSRDGTRFLMNLPLDGREADPITVVVNWTALLPSTTRTPPR